MTSSRFSGSEMIFARWPPAAPMVCSFEWRLFEGQWQAEIRKCSGDVRKVYVHLLLCTAADAHHDLPEQVVDNLEGLGVSSFPACAHL